LPEHGCGLSSCLPPHRLHQCLQQPLQGGLQVCGLSRTPRFRLLRGRSSKSCAGWTRLRSGYNSVILSGMKTAISLSDETFQRVDHAARRLGVSRSEFFAQAAERWLEALDDDGTTEAIDRAIAGLEIDNAFTAAAAAALAADDHV